MSEEVYEGCGPSIIGEVAAQLPVMTLDEVVAAVDSLIARQKPWLRRPSDVSVEDLGPIMREVHAGTCPPPVCIRMSRATFADVEVSTGAREMLHMQPMPFVQCVIDEAVPVGRMHVEWPDAP